MKKVLFLTLSTIFSITLLHAQQPVVVTNKDSGWHKIGDAKVDFKTDKDRFIIMGADKFSSIKLKVFDAPVKIDDLEIKYEGDAKESVMIGKELKPDTESDTFKLKHNNVSIQTVMFVYHTVANSAGNKARLELWGRKP
jgi:hypothetical protein